MELGKLKPQHILDTEKEKIARDIIAIAQMVRESSFHDHDLEVVFTAIIQVAYPQLATVQALSDGDILDI